MKPNNYNIDSLAASSVLIARTLQVLAEQKHDLNMSDVLARHVVMAQAAEPMRRPAALTLGHLPNVWP